MLAELHSERFVDSAPAQVWATLLDEGRYLASERTMYRLLAGEHGEVRERRAQLEHPAYARPELLAERPRCSASPSERSKFLVAHPGMRALTSSSRSSDVRITR